MDIGQLRVVLKQIQDIYAAGGAKSQVNDFHTVIRLLEGHDHESVDQFVKSTEQTLKSPTKLTKSKTNKATVKQHVNSLKAAKTDRESFEQAFSLLLTDRKVRKIEALEITKQYTGYSMNFKTKKKALDEIRAKFIELASHETRMSIIDKITPW